MKISPSRQAVFEILIRIEKERSFSSILLPIYEEKLGPKDSALCHELTLGVLRNKLLLDRQIQFFTRKKLNKLDIEVLTALRIGLYQLYFLDKIPPYSAINESVNLVKAAKKRSASGFVNAILRRASKGKPELEFQDEVEKLSAETSNPRWLIERWIAQFGPDETRKMAAVNNIPPPLYIRLTKRFYESDDGAREAILAMLEESKVPDISIELPENCYLVRNGNEKLRQFAELGLIYFQDAASIMVADLISLKNGERLLDLCASPGSKTSRIAAGGSIKDTVIVAGDFYESRNRLLKQNLNKQLITDIDIVQYDAEKSLPFEIESYDVVLIDAPCSGTGTIRRNPEIRYYLKESDLKTLSDKQLNILKNASKLIKPLGRLIYSTCSIESEENEHVIAEFLSSNEKFGLEKIKLSDRFLTKRGFARTFSHRDNMDGFFVAIMSRRA